MSAEESLSEHQFPAHVYHVEPHEIGFLQMRDYPGKLGDLEFHPGGESDERVRAIMETAQHVGIHTPIQIGRSGTSYLREGHHRFVAARRLGIKLPVEDVD